MKTLEMAKKAFANRRAVDAWFEEVAPNFEAFSEMVRIDERQRLAAEKCESTIEDQPNRLVNSTRKCDI